MGRSSVYIFECKNGDYEKMHEFSPTYLGMPPSITLEDDMNRNGIPELLIYYWGTQGGKYASLLEWDGGQFSDLILPATSNEYAYTESSLMVPWGYISVENLNNDPFPEIITDDGIPIGDTCNLGFPWRTGHRYYRWDGYHYIRYKLTFAPPMFRFEAVQDGDRASLIGDYDKALAAYQQAIFNENLKSFSFDSAIYYRNEICFGIRQKEEPPAEDPVEYANLAAYSWYRIMLIHAVRGYYSDAEVILNEMSIRYPEGKPGNIYAQMAEIFLRNHPEKSLSQACQQVISYAQNHISEIHSYLNRGWGSSNPFGDDLRLIDYSQNLQVICPFQ